MTAEPSTVFAGDTITINIDIDMADNTSGCTFTLRYPAQHLTLEKISTDFFKPVFDNRNGADTSQVDSWQANNAVPGKIEFSGAYVNTGTGGPQYTGKQTLFTVQFRIINDIQTSTINFEIEQTHILSAQAGWGIEGVAEPAIIIANSYPVLESFPSNPKIGIVVDTFHDADNDGIEDDDDLCPGTPENESVDASGCSSSQRDSDNDGVFDDMDECPGTLFDDQVSATGCAASQIDSDNDGISDAEDTPNKVVNMSPSDQTDDASPEFSWIPDPVATWYKVLVWDSAKKVIMDKWYETEDVLFDGICSVTMASDLKPGKYQMWIRPWNPNGYGPWSDILNFSTQGTDTCKATPGDIVKTSPSGLITTSNPTFTFDENRCSTWYQLYLNNSAGNKLHDKWYRQSDICSEGTCDTVIDMNLQNDTYQWWVRGWNEFGNGTWGSKSQFTIESGHTMPPEAATLLYPQLSTNNPVTYIWNAVPNSTWYHLWVDDENGTQIKKWITADKAGCESGTGTCSHTPESTVAVSGDCIWWIQTYNNHGYGSWSSGALFIVSD